MSKKNYEEMSRQIIEAVGGKDNIQLCYHCATRLRFHLKDLSKADTAVINKIDGVISTKLTGDQLQLIIGNDVEDVYLEVCKQADIETQEAIDEDLDGPKEKQKFSIKGTVNLLIKTVTDCAIPIFPVFTLGGLTKLLVALLGSSMLGILPDDSDFMRMMAIVGNSCFYFLPMYAAYASSKRFKTNTVIAMLFAGIMLYPDFVNIVAEGEAFSVYGIPMILTDYASSFLPIILITWIMSYVEKYLKQFIPKSVRSILLPFGTLLIMLPLAFCVLGPVGTILGNGISNVIIWLKDIFGPFATGLVGALFPFLIVTGMHHALNSVAFVDFAAKGFDNCIWAASYIMDYQLLGLCFASLIKSRRAENKAYAVNCIITEGIGGISEPTIYGIVLKSKKTIAITLISGFIGGFYIGLMDVHMYTFAAAGFPAIFAYGGGSNMNFIHGIIACALSFGISFILGLVLGLDHEEETVVEEDSDMISTNAVEA